MKFMKTALIFIFVLCFVMPTVEQQIRTTFSTSINNQFSGFDLDNKISSILIQYEVIRISGKINDPNFYIEDEAKSFLFFVNFTLKNDSNVNFTCRDVFPLNTLKFDLSCRIKKVGQFFIKLSASPASLFQYALPNYSKLYIYSSDIVRTIKPFSSFLVPNIALKQPPQPEGLEFNFINNTIELKWKSNAAITNVTFYQISSKTNKLEKKQFLLSGNHQIFYPDFFQFRFFYPGKTTVEISHALSQDGTLNKISSPFTVKKQSITFNAMRHLKQANSQIRYSVFPSLPTVLKVAERFNFTLTFKNRAKTIYYMISLDQKTSRRVYFYKSKPDEQDEVKQNVPINIQVVFQKPGTYLMNFQAVDRKTILNQPIYVGVGTPFLPDYFDYYELFFENYFESMLQIQQEYIARYLTDGKIYKDPGFSAPLKQQRAFLFQLLNYERKKYNAPLLVYDETIEKMAQDHCQDMLENNYTNSKNLKGQLPLQRALRYNLTSYVRQYIMASYSLGGMHLDAQIVGYKIDITANKMLSRVGIGIVINNSYVPPFYVATYDFSIRDLTLYPPDPTQLQKFRLQIIKTIIQKNPNIKSENKNLSSIIKTWITQNTIHKSQQLQSLLQKKWNKRIRVEVKDIFYYEEQIENIRENEDYSNKVGTQIGLGLTVNKQSKSSLLGFLVLV